jgi:hypothetical protein
MPLKPISFSKVNDMLGWYNLKLLQPQSIPTAYGTISQIVNQGMTSSCRSTTDIGLKYLHDTFKQIKNAWNKTLRSF